MLLQVQHLTSTQALQILAGLTVAYQLCKIIYRLYFHPLRNFPGPRLAAATHLYVHYYQMLHKGIGGQLIFQLPRLHARYGPIVRLGPDELHFSNPDVYSKIYFGTPAHTFPKDPSFYRTWAQGANLVATCGSAEARGRREVLAPLFSRRTVVEMQDVLREMAELLMQRMVEYGSVDGKGEGVDMFPAFKSLTTDIITKHCFGQSVDCLHHPTFQAPYIKCIGALVAHSMRMIFLWRPILVIQQLPEALLVLIAPILKGPVQTKQLARQLLHGFINDREKARAQAGGRETVFERLLTPNPEKGYPVVLPEPVLVEEAVMLLGAGAEEVGNSLGFALYYLLVNPEGRKKLVEELDAVVREDREAGGKGEMELTRLEKLPYLNGVVKESTRFAGVPGRLLRLIPKDGANLDGVDIPGGTSVYQCNYMIHFNPDIFEDPWEFRPERWIEDKERKLEHYHVAFTKGPRKCLGINLANAELTITLAYLFQRLDMTLWNTTAKDMEWDDHLSTDIRGKLRVKAKWREIEA